MRRLTFVRGATNTSHVTLFRGSRDVSRVKASEAGLPKPSQWREETTLTLSRIVATLAAINCYGVYSQANCHKIIKRALSYNHGHRNSYPFSNEWLDATVPLSAIIWSRREGVMSIASIPQIMGDMIHGKTSSEKS
jgi:hypothetical protein